MYRGPNSAADRGMWSSNSLSPDRSRQLHLMNVFSCYSQVPVNVQPFMSVSKREWAARKRVTDDIS